MLVGDTMRSTRPTPGRVALCPTGAPSMGKLIRHIDLTPEEPGARADVGLKLDEVSLEAEVPLARFRFSSKAGTRSTLQSAMETVSVAAAGCVRVFTMSGIGGP